MGLATEEEPLFTETDPAWQEFVLAAERLVARRREQRGHHTHGDDLDAAVVASLAALGRSPSAQAHAAEVAEIGVRVGRDVHARRVFEDSLPGALITLSTTLTAGGLGSLELDDLFHRTLTARFRALAPVGDAALAPFLRGILKGYFGEAFNCNVDVRSDGVRFEIQLREGRDVNRRETA